MSNSHSVKPYLKPPGSSTLNYNPWLEEGQRETGREDRQLSGEALVPGKVLEASREAPRFSKSQS